MNSAQSTTPVESPRLVSVATSAAAWAVAFLVLRIFAISDYHWETAFAVGTTLGLDDGLALIFGSLMAGHLLTALLLTCLLPLLVAALLWGPRTHRTWVMLLSVLGVVILIALTVSFHYWWLPPASVAVLGLLVLIRLLPKLQKASQLAITHVGRLAAVAILVLAALVDRPWVPHEDIHTVDGTVTGYVLSVDSGYLNVLTDDRKFVILISSDVTARTDAE